MIKIDDNIEYRNIDDKKSSFLSSIENYFFINKICLKYFSYLRYRLFKIQEIVRLCKPSFSPLEAASALASRTT